MRTIDSETIAALRMVLDMYMPDEQKDYEAGNDTAEHIYSQLRKVKVWLDFSGEPANRVPTVKISNMTSPRGSEVPNQFEITTDEGDFFQSYRSIIAFKPRGGGKVVLDESKWDYSTTTGKYRNQFLGEGIEDTRKKIKSGEYLLADLNQ